MGLKQIFIKCFFPKQSNQYCSEYIKINKSYHKIKNVIFHRPYSNNAITYNQDIFNEDINSLHLNTNLNIEFQELKFLDDLKIFFKKNIPLYYFITEDSFEHDVKVCGYNKKLGLLNTKILYYFVDKFFLMGEYIIPEISEIKKNEIVENIIYKYCRNKMSINGNFSIIDKDKNKLLIMWNGFDLSIRFVSNHIHNYKDVFVKQNYIFSFKERNISNFIKNSLLKAGIF